MARAPGTLRQRALILAAYVLALSGCASFPRLQATPGVGLPDGAATIAGPREDAASSAIEIIAPSPAETPAIAEVQRTAPTQEQISALVDARDLQVSLPPQPLPQFLDTVFGELLRVPYAMGPGVAERREIIALRGPDVMTTTRLFTMAQMSLAQYGLAVVIDEGGVHILDDTVLSGRAPSFIRARTGPETPGPSRPVMQFFPISTLDVASILPVLEQAYPNRGSVRFTANEDTNTLLISGGARDVAAAAAVLRELDQPHFSSGQIARIEPVFLSVEQLAEEVTLALRAEGYRVQNPLEARGGSLVLLPLPNANQVLLFASDTRMFDRALHWIRTLDSASALGNGEGLFIYTAQNVSAEELAALVGPGSAASESAASVTPPEIAVRRNGNSGGGRTVQPVARGAGGITVDAIGNRLIFRGTSSEYQRLRDTLVQLDQPPRQVLVELTIAEVTLTDETRFGIEWFLDQTITDGTLTATTEGGTTRQPGGLGVVASHVFSRGRVEAALNAFASNRNLNILSTPRVFTRSGNEAEILVGIDVPIITSQRASDSQSSGDTDVLQTVQYRQTGIILNVRPIVYGDDRIDISLYQEVSSQQPNTSAAINSPLILNRSVSTQISLQEGMTAVIGGLMQDTYTRDQRGIPGLKDLPVIGAAFRSEEVTGDKVELVILLTPYIVRDDDDVQAMTDALTRSVNSSLRRRGAQVYTLYPWRTPFSSDRTHDRLTPRPPALN
ncbi:secretin N-terminal domain-containing protein [Vitreimonas flagellata]|uniref:secretin N-terminal domain-containing protein n=1 Tax=Vitreimonas flagellata TaxID=2560861 RepID=UPI00143212E3|nr:secretin N-terminal domain-containing protein [Vitreimonas flagellata]